MSNTETKKEVKKEDNRPKEFKGLTKEQLKEKFRSLRLDYMGRLYVDEKYRKSDKILRIDNDDPATRKELEKLGYVPVQAIPDAEHGSGSLSEGSNIGSEVHYEMGKTMSQPGILYEIDKDVFEARMEVEAERNDAQLQEYVEDNSLSSLVDKYQLKK